MSRDSGAVLQVRELTENDLERVVAIDALHSGTRKEVYWQRVFREFVHRKDRVDRVALGVDAGEGLAGYLFGEVRAFEYGSEPCGWVFGVGVEPGHLRQGLASGLLREAVNMFRSYGVRKVRTMVLRDDVPVLAFFRSHDMEGGPFVQLELDLREGA